jgi:acetyl-CoA carboxylase biotin carboxylase subunit
MFKKILIANRGEIAVRIINTCHKMGIKTVAIYSDADQDSMHVKMADESFRVGESRVKDSYLNIKRIIEVAKESNCEAIHPGYGLLSENKEFAVAVNEAGIKFIGPKPEIIGKMGSKIESRKIMNDAGVPIVPGSENPLANVEEAVQYANEMGYPVMLKASAGGGGIGMEIIHDEKSLTKSFDSNKKRAQDFFNDGSMFIEKYIENPRHIEIQVLADEYGNAIHLWERECSVQRRHQKVVEEAPSSFLTDELRKLMGETAVKAVKEIQYSNAGTIEFLMDDKKNYYFLEMNTRLQVEHPVTEEITGIDLVEEQLRITNGEKLRYSQNEVASNGHAIEVRVYAEDPKTFFPSPGKITQFYIPSDNSIRKELSVSEGTTITPYYDPMIAKIISHGNTRDQAIDKLLNTLKSSHIEGIKTNIPMLISVLEHEVFKKGMATTNFVNNYLKNQ